MWLHHMMTSGALCKLAWRECRLVSQESATLWHHSGHLWACHDVCNEPIQSRRMVSSRTCFAWSDFEEESHCFFKAERLVHRWVIDVPWGTCQRWRRVFCVTSQVRDTRVFSFNFSGVLMIGCLNRMPKMRQYHLQVAPRPSKSLLDPVVMSWMRPSLFQPR